MDLRLIDQPSSGPASAGKIGMGAYDLDLQSTARELVGFVSDIVTRLQLQLFSDSIWLQLGGGIAALFLAFAVMQSLRPVLGGFLGEFASGFKNGRYEKSLRGAVLPGLIAMFAWLIIAGFSSRGLPVEYLRIFGAIMVAIGLARLLVHEHSTVGWKITVLLLAWGIAALTALRLMAPLLGFVDELIVPIGTNLSLLDVIRATIIAVGLVWSASALSRLVEARLGKSAYMTPSVRGLLGQLVRILMIGAAIVYALNTIGIDLTAFAVFSGALGVGIGFGLQSIFSNFVAGIIIILEKTLKVGDFVDLQTGITGEVKEINVRSTLIRTNDNIDMLVPNSEFVNNSVTNWTLREAKRRIHIPVGVAYGSDKDLVKKALLEAADRVEYTLKDNESRQPDVWLVNFGDSSLDFELVVWLTDEATKKPAKVHAAYCWEIDTAFAQHGITIPFPQRDLHIIPA